MELTVSSEIYAETDFDPVKTDNGNVISKFRFFSPPEKVSDLDKDGDLDVKRKEQKIIAIEHSASTVLKLVGLQVWRGALLLADFLFHCRGDISNKNILELGSGVGLTSITAAMFAKTVVCTDINVGGILDLIRNNIEKNKRFLKCDIAVLELNFKSEKFEENLEKYIEECDIVLAADVIYDDDLTESFVFTLDKLLNKERYKRRKIIYIALEKRYVFTTSDVDLCPPCYDFFLQMIAKKSWKVENVAIDFPQFFIYERCKELVLLKISH
ncbi:methyltransferase-like protein 22 [Condylostylus longicornis]|uniref:methyltransferase-like protein 22 n=1 Tax=Condylostylus longicornis TaxID=2530218 RepID=UPI00244E2323|nr:methyltransferase-like protein 22 [Condylostylus longicornis]